MRWRGRWSKWGRRYTEKSKKVVLSLRQRGGKFRPDRKLKETINETLSQTVFTTTHSRVQSGVLRTLGDERNPRMYQWFGPIGGPSTLWCTPSQLSQVYEGAFGVFTISRTDSSRFNGGTGCRQVSTYSVGGSTWAKFNYCTFLWIDLFGNNKIR